MGKVVPTFWVIHRRANAAPAQVIDGDTVFLHGADWLAAQAQREKGSRWRGSYYMPAQADRCAAPLLWGPRSVFLCTCLHRASLLEAWRAVCFGNAGIVDAPAVDGGSNGRSAHMCMPGAESLQEALP
jgi:hypothetical protein